MLPLLCSMPTSVHRDSYSCSTGVGLNARHHLWSSAKSLQSIQHVTPCYLDDLATKCNLVDTKPNIYSSHQKARRPWMKVAGAQCQLATMTAGQPEGSSSHTTHRADTAAAALPVAHSTIVLNTGQRPLPAKQAFCVVATQQPCQQSRLAKQAQRGCHAK